MTKHSLVIDSGNDVEYGVWKQAACECGAALFSPRRFVTYLGERNVQGALTLDWEAHQANAVLREARENVQKLQDVHEYSQQLRKTAGFVLNRETKLILDGISEHLESLIS